MKCHVIILDTTGTTYTFYEIEKQKETKKNKNKKDKSKEKGNKQTIEETSCRATPAGDVADTSKERAGKKKNKRRKMPLLVSRVEQSPKEK